MSIQHRILKINAIKRIALFKILIPQFPSRKGNLALSFVHSYVSYLKFIYIKQMKMKIKNMLHLNYVSHLKSTTRNYSS